MEKTREEMLTIIRKVIGNKRFIFSDAYVKKAGYPKVGNSCEVCAITRQNIFFTAKVLINYYYDEETDNYPANIDKLPIFRRFDGFTRSNLKLDDLSLADLTSLFNDLKYYLWWENDVRLPEIKKEFKECEEKAKMFEKVNRIDLILHKRC
jgi:hypothetical protein